MGKPEMENTSYFMMESHIFIGSYTSLLQHSVAASISGFKKHLTNTYLNNLAKMSPLGWTYQDCVSVANHRTVWRLCFIIKEFWSIFQYHWSDLLGQRLRCFSHHLKDSTFLVVCYSFIKRLLAEKRKVSIAPKNIVSWSLSVS